MSIDWKSSNSEIFFYAQRIIVGYKPLKIAWKRVDMKSIWLEDCHKNMTTIFSLVVKATFSGEKYVEYWREQSKVIHKLLRKNHGSIGVFFHVFFAHFSSSSYIVHLVSLFIYSRFTEHYYLDIENWYLWFICENNEEKTHENNKINSKQLKRITCM